jgi:hypothetical protein
VTFEAVHLTWQDLLTAFPVGGCLTLLLLALGHWVPAGGGRGQLPTTVYGLIGRYVYGTFMVLVGFTVAIAMLGLPWWLPAGLLVVDMIGGSAVVIAYTWDRVHDAILQSRMAKQADDELRPQG